MTQLSKLQLVTMTDLDRLSIIHSNMTDCIFPPSPTEAMYSHWLWTPQSPTTTTQMPSSQFNNNKKPLTLISVHRFSILFHDPIPAKSLLEINFYSPKFGICSYNLSVCVYSHCQSYPRSLPTCFIVKYLSDLIIMVRLENYLLSREYYSTWMHTIPIFYMHSRQ